MPDSRAERLIDKATTALRQGNAASATMAINKLTRLAPALPETQLLQAELSFADGNLFAGTIQLTRLADETGLPAGVQTKLLSLLNQFELYFPLRSLLATEPTSLDANTLALATAKAHLYTGDIEGAKSRLESILNNSKDAEIYLLLGHVYKATADTEKAAQAYKQYIEREPTQAAIGYWSLADLKAYRFSAEDIANIQAHIASQGNRWLTGLATLALSRAREQQKQPDVTTLLQANANIAASRPFNSNGFSYLVDALSNWIPIQRDDRPSLTVPWFIVGLPRSGTTLTEQILSGHSEVCATDELPYMERVALQLTARKDYGAAISSLTPSQIEQAKIFYESQIRQYMPEFGGHRIDKNPNNWIHIGLMKTLFPTTKILCTIRPILDNAVSLLRQYFAKGNDYAYSPAAIIQYMLAHYRLMLHWKNVYGTSLKIVDYEALVSAPDSYTRQLLEYCELSFESQCLRFYESTAPVLTPSASQVRSPVNTNSLGSGQQYVDAFADYQEEIKQLNTMRDQLLNLP